MSTLQVLSAQPITSRAIRTPPVTPGRVWGRSVPHLRSCLSHRQAVQKHFGKQLRFVFRNFPLAQLHPEAESAAETAEFAGAHGHFWEVHDALYENQDELGLPFYLALAEALNLPEPRVRGDGEQRLHGRDDPSGGGHQYHGAHLEQPIGFRRGHFLHVPSCSHELMPGCQEAIAGKASAKFLGQREGYSQLSEVQLSV